jgi:hypothetical protein
MPEWFQETVVLLCLLIAASYLISRWAQKRGKEAGCNQCPIPKPSPTERKEKAPEEKLDGSTDS